MSSPLITGFLTRIAADARTDGELVREYAATHSDAAFAELVRRLAPMVWGVCRRVVGHRQHAEDAFQAAFLVLARKAGSVRPPAAIGGWLHAVAVHTSLRVRTLADRHRRRFAPLADDPVSPMPTEPTDPDALRALDEEIANLPDVQRTAVTLCELDAVSRKDAAKRLGIAEGTLSSRLAAARKSLAARLRGRGIVLSAVLALVSRTDAAPPLASAASETASTLADGVIRAMFLKKLKLPALLTLLALAAVGTGFSLAAPPDRERIQIKAPVKAAAPKEGKILFWVDEKPQLLKPDGTELDSPKPIEKVFMGVPGENARLSPDGKRVAFLKQGAAMNVAPPKNVPKGAIFDNRRQTLQFLDFEGRQEATSVPGMAIGDFRWLGDGSKVYAYGSEIGEGDVPGKAGPWVLNLATGKPTPLELPDGFHVKTFAPDGKTALVEEIRRDPKVWHRHVHLWAGGKDDKPTPLLELNDSLHSPTFSPDGSRLLGVTSHATYTPQGNGVWNVSDTKFNRLVVIDVATKKQTELRDLMKGAEWEIAGLAWSPDGKRIGCAEIQRLRGQGAGKDLFRVTVSDADGTNAKEVYRTQGQWLMGFDWR